MLVLFSSEAQKPQTNKNSAPAERRDRTGHPAFKMETRHSVF